jgi:hypothetical protein
VTVVRPDIAAGWLQVVPAEAFPILKEAFLTHPGAASTENQGIHREYHKRVHVGADILRAYDASVDIES